MVSIQNLVPKPNRKNWVWSYFFFTTGWATSMLIKPNGVFQDTPTPVPTRGAAVLAP